MTNKDDGRDIKPSDWTKLRANDDGDGVSLLRLSAGS